jgi:creatinine amidohydrolase
MDELFIQRMTWPQVEAAIAYGATTAIVCAASTEQHGPHLPEATDELLGEAYAAGLARRLDQALVAPVFRPGCSDHHMAFAGSLTLPPELLMDVLDHYLASLRRHGFTRFVVFSSHGGNYPVLARWVAERSPADAVVLTDLGLFEVGFQALRRFGRDDHAGPHAEVLETSMMLYLHPGLVRMDLAEPGFTGEIEPLEAMSRGFRTFTANGIIGNPVGSTPQIGKAVLEAICDELAAQVGAHA